MKKIILILLLSISYVSYSQTFEGLKIGGNIETFISSMKAKKYSFLKWGLPNVAIMTGNVGNEQVEVFISCTPVSKQVKSLNIFFDERNTWDKLKSNYDEIVLLFTNKYGTPDDVYETFIDKSIPEIEAIENDRATFSRYWWAKNGTNLSVQISKYKQVKIVYESMENTALSETEENNIKKSKF